jgi:hypothetical protein
MVPFLRLQQALRRRPGRRIREVTGRREERAEAAKAVAAEKEAITADVVSLWRELLDRNPSAASKALWTKRILADPGARHKMRVLLRKTAKENR